MGWRRMFLPMIPFLKNNGLEPRKSAELWVEGRRRFCPNLDWSAGTQIIRVMPD
jgi:hypothetical protein